jgi:hypothetical protein
MICGYSKWRYCSTFITTSPFTVTTNRDDIIDNLSTISETRETKSSTTNYLVTEGKNKHFCIKKTCFSVSLVSDIVERLPIISS